MPQCSAVLGGAEQPRPSPDLVLGNMLQIAMMKEKTIHSQIDIMRRTPGLVSTSQSTMGFMQN